MAARVKMLVFADLSMKRGHAIAILWRAEGIWQKGPKTCKLVILAHCGTAAFVSPPTRDNRVVVAAAGGRSAESIPPPSYVLDDHHR